MAFFSFTGHCCALVLILLSVHTSNIVQASSKQTANAETNSKNKELVAQTLESLEESEVEKGTKLIRVIVSPTSSNFFQVGKENGTPLYAWNNTQNVPSSENDIVVIDFEENKARRKQGNPWKSRVFLALKPISSESSESEIFYYSLVAYVRRSTTGTSIEWDQVWSGVAQGLDEVRKSKEIDQEMFISPILCSYGSCGCSGCVDCRKPSSTITQNASQLDKEPKKPGNAYAKADAEFGDSRANANSDNGTAKAESTARDGHSLAYAKGRDHAVAESDTDTGSSRSMSVAERGFAQASAQSATDDEHIMAKADNTGAQFHSDHDYDNEKDLVDDGANDMFDALSIFNDTNSAFNKAQERSLAAKARAKGERRLGTCSQEKEISVVVSNQELGKFVKGGPKNKDKTIVYENPLFFGMDPDLTVNKSVTIALKTTGYNILRKACDCDPDEIAPQAMGFLQFLDQHCRSDLVKRLKNVESTSSSELKQSLQQNKVLTRNQTLDIVSTILLASYTSSEKDNSIRLIQKVFKNTTSSNITEIAAIALNAMHYTVTVGRLHKVKLLKALSLNVLSVWTGLLLESKRCTIEKSCRDDQQEMLTKDHNLIFGLQIFLKAVDTLYTNANSAANPVEIFLRFVHFYKNDIAKLVDCKIRRVITPTADKIL